MRPEVIEQRLLIFREPEEVVLLADPFGLQRRVERTVAVDEILFLLELFAADAVPAFVHALVNVAGIVDALRDLGDTGLVPRFGRADEVVEGDVETLPRGPEPLLHLVAVRERIEALLDRLLVHVLRMLVAAHQETRVEAREALVARDDVGAHLLVGRPEMRPAVDVIDRGRQEESFHEWLTPYACIAIAWTSLTERLLAAASVAQSSNSGVALTMRPSRRAILKRTAPSGVSTATISRSRHSRSTS